MSRKKYQKRHHNSTVAAKRRAAQEELADQKDRARKRMDPTARTLLLGDLVFLAICQLMFSAGLMSDLASGITTIVGAVVLVVALWFQFGNKGKKDGGSGPRLR